MTPFGPALTPPWCFMSEPLSGLAQADSYPEHERRRRLLAKVEQLLRRYYPPERDPYRLFEQRVSRYLHPGATLLDAGCGRSAPVLNSLAPLVRRAIGVELVEFDQAPAHPNMELVQAGLDRIPLPDASVDVIMSRSVMEHVADPGGALREVARLLKPGGRYVFITPNLWSYPILIAKMVPNRFHAAIVDFAEGRPAEDTFPTYHRINTPRAVRKWANQAGLEAVSIEYLEMFPAYLMFHPWAFRLGILLERSFRIPGLRWLQHFLLVELRKPPVAGVRGVEQ